MKITPDLFEAFLKCPTKCWLRSAGEPASGNAYAEWVKSQNESYRATASERLLSKTPKDESALSPPAENLKAARWRLAADVLAQTPEAKPCSSRRNEAQTSTSEISQGLLTSTLANDQARPDWIAESRLHAIERVVSEGRGRSAQFIPIRFIFTNKLGKDEKLLLAFDAFALSEMIGREVSIGKIIHGDDHATQKVKTSALAGEVRKRIEKIYALLSSSSPPDLVLNRHCAECEFQVRCRQKAIETDDLSLLAGMSAKERQELRSKGIFTVTQLSYTFRPRRRPKRLRDKREKNHHSLKALAIREKKIHVVGSPELKIEGTPVYLDVEGLPDRDFYYLIGLRIGNGESAVQHSLWADTVADEGKIWREFLGILETVEQPVLIHYGSYETIFFKRINERHGSSQVDFPISARAVESSLNALSFVFGRIYFPTFSNGLKDVARFLGFNWSDPYATGTRTISLRGEWELSGQPYIKDILLTYNTEDCTALQRVVEFLSFIHSNGDPKTNTGAQSVVNAENLPRESFGVFRKNHFLLPELDEINKAAYWDYQREKVFVKTNKRPRTTRPKSIRRNSKPKANKIVEWSGPPKCPECGEKKLYKHAAYSKTVLDLRFSRSGLRRWVTRFKFYRYRCTRCRAVVHNPERPWSREKHGRDLRAFAVYQIVELRLPQETVATFLNRLLGFNLCRGTINKMKVAAAEFYQPTYDNLLKRITAGRLVHADETKVDYKSRRGYVWTFTNMEEVAFVFAESREGDLVQSLLKNFNGVLVTDFYAAYESIRCPQQKCLIHLIRDLNNDLMAEPFNEELKNLVADFTRLVRPMIATVDQYGLKARFLHKHKAEVEWFYRALRSLDPQSETAQKCKTRFERNQDSLFTFLDYDGVPWNNNNAEHAIKSFALLRRVFSGVTTEKGIREYLVLLSVCETCKYMGLDFLDFLRSGEKDIHAFAESRQGRRRRFDSDRSAAVKSTAASVSDSNQAGSST
jgi:predicted RecB family nuclease